MRFSGQGSGAVVQLMPFILHSIKILVEVHKVSSIAFH
jgi:hypothetical protein